LTSIATSLKVAPLGARTEEVVSGEMVGVPDLEVESSRNLRFRLIPREHVILARDNDLFLRHEVVERKDEAPVEVAFSRQRPVTT